MDLGFVSQELPVYSTKFKRVTLLLTLSFMYEAWLFTWSEYEIAEQGSDLLLLRHLEASLHTERVCHLLYAHLYIKLCLE